MRDQNLNNPLNWTRRDFVKASGGCGALTSATFLSTLLNLQLTKTAMAAAGDLSGYKALVCVFHHGGNDSFNMLAPYDDADYAAVRGGLALSKVDDELLSISGPSGRQFGIHHGMPEFQQLYNDEKLAFLSNVGSLIGPTTKQDYTSQTGLPLGLFSHSDEQRHWQTCVPQSRTQITGWAGRMADMITDTVNSNPTVSMNIAVGFMNILQAGDSVIPYVIDRIGGRNCFPVTTGREPTTGFCRKRPTVCWNRRLRIYWNKRMPSVVAVRLTQLSSSITQSTRSRSTQCFPVLRSDSSCR